MSNLTRENFETKAQFERYLAIKNYVKELIRLQRAGNKIYENGRLVDGEFFISGENIGQEVGNTRFLYIGDTHGRNKKTGDYDLLYIPYTIKRFKKQHNFQLVNGFTDIN